MKSERPSVMVIIMGITFICGAAQFGDTHLTWVLAMIPLCLYLIPAGEIVVERDVESPRAADAREFERRKTMN